MNNQLVASLQNTSVSRKEPGHFQPAFGVTVMRKEVFPVKVRYIKYELLDFIKILGVLEVFQS